MDSWRSTTLDQLGRIVTGKTPSTSDSKNYGGDIPFVTPTDMNGRRIISSTGRYVSYKGANAVASARIPRKAVMVSCIGSDMGKAAMSGRDCITNQQINSIIVDQANDPLFVYYNLSNRKDEIRAAASGSAQPIMNKSAFGRLPISLPSLDKQRAISSVLSALDDKIDLNRRTNETLEAMARAIFKDWFVDFGPTRAKAAGRDPYLAPEIWELFPSALDDVTNLPESWIPSKVEDYLELAYGKSLPAKTRRPGKVTVYGSGGLAGFHDDALIDGPAVIVGRKGTVGSLYWEDRSVFPIDTVFYVVPKRSPLLFCYQLLIWIDLSMVTRKSR